MKQTAKDKVVSMFLSGNREFLMEDYKRTISDFGQYNFFFAFKRHLVHLGVLSNYVRIKDKEPYNSQIGKIKAFDGNFFTIELKNIKKRSTVWRVKLILLNI